MSMKIEIIPLLDGVLNICNERHENHKGEGRQGPCHLKFYNSVKMANIYSKTGKSL